MQLSRTDGAQAWRSIRKGTVAAVAAGVVAGVLGAMVVVSATRAAPQPRLPGEIVWAAGVRPAPGFALTDQTGRARTLADLRGRTVLLTFMDPLCTKECPIEGRELGAVQAAFPASARPTIVVITVNTRPGANAPATLRRDATEWGWTGPWYWLSGSSGGLAGVWRSYGVQVVPTKADINHTSVLYVIDGHGFQRAGWSVPLLPRLVATDVRDLSAGSPSLWHRMWSWL